MAILINKDTRFICQGITGTQASMQAKRALAYGSKLVAGTTLHPKKESHLGLPLYESVQQAQQACQPNATIIYTPPASGADAILEAVAAQIPLIVCITEGIPILDMMRIKALLAGAPVRLIGPNCLGVITPGACNMGIMPTNMFNPGVVGVVSRSGSLSYEAIEQINACGLGQSSCVGIGGDAIMGSSFVDILDLFEQDTHTQVILLIGEIGGFEEERAAKHIAAHITKPVVAYVAGKESPTNIIMGHAGAIISAGLGTAQSKTTALAQVGVHVVEDIARIGESVQEALNNI